MIAALSRGGRAAAGLTHSRPELGCVGSEDARHKSLGFMRKKRCRGGWGGEHHMCFVCSRICPAAWESFYCFTKRAATDQDVFQHNCIYKEFGHAPKQKISNSQPPPFFPPVFFKGKSHFSPPEWLVLSQSNQTELKPSVAPPLLCKPPGTSQITPRLPAPPASPHHGPTEPLTWG